MWDIIKSHITENFAETSEKIKYIVIHDTGNASPSADARAYRNYFDDKCAHASCHYVCDEDGILECVGKGCAAYHTGVERNGVRRDGKLSFITDYNSVGIVYCICKGKDIKKSVRNAAIAAAYACRLHGLSSENIVRHYDATDSICPCTMYDNQTGIASDAHVKWADFEAFKVMVSEILQAAEQSQELCDDFFNRGYITDKEYWERALAGLGELDLKWLRMLLYRVR